MRYVKPHYYDAFRCIADKCPDTCCAGWQIVIDEETLEKYADSKGAFSSRLKNSIDWQEGCFHQYHGRCAMLNENNLCDLVTEKGEEWLCDTCNRYPRHIEEFDGVREMSLSLSCPVAAKMILECEEPLHFLIEENEAEDPLEEEFEDFDFLLFTQLEDARSVLFSIVQNRNISIEQRMMAIVKMAKEMQACVDEERLFDMEDVIAGYAKANEQGTLAEKRLSREECFKQRKEGFHFLLQLERLRSDWEEVLSGTEKILYAKGYEAYTSLCDTFQKEFVMEMGEQKWEVLKEQLLMFFLYTYFCGAVYDDCIFSKVALAAFSVCSIQEFIMAGFFLADGKMDMQECIRLSYRYAREVEHSDENLNLLEEWLMEFTQ